MPILCPIGHEPESESDSTASGIFFIHIPKTGGTSIEHEFKTRGMLRLEESFLYTPWCRFVQKNRTDRIRCSLQHLTFTELAHIRPTVLSRMKGLFTVVRNPYDRILSEFYYMKKRLLAKDRDCKLWGLSPAWRTRYLKNPNTFVRGVYELYLHNPHILDNHFLPQVDFLKGLDIHPLRHHAKIYSFEEIRQGTLITSIYRDFGADLNWQIETESDGDVGVSPQEGMMPSCMDNPTEADGTQIAQTDVPEKSTHLVHGSSLSTDPFRMVHKNRFTPRKPIEYTIEPATIFLIQKWYAADFQFFGFPLAPPASWSDQISAI